MTPPYVVVMLARQRSGTNPLRSVLNTHPEVFCTPEVFHDEPSPDAELAVETNFFRFAEGHPRGARRRALSFADQEAIFVDFLDYLAGMSPKRFTVIDVKYNSTHHLNAAWKFISAEPTLFTLIKGHRLKVLNLTRANLLRYYLSQQKATRTQAWTVAATQSERTMSGDQRIRVDVADLLRTLQLCRSENAVVEDSFSGYRRYLALDYTELFTSLGSPVTHEALSRIAAWLELDESFEAEPTFAKQAVMSLQDTIENFDDVKAALRGTSFEHCLSDEPMYRSSAPQPDDRRPIRPRPRTPAQGP